MSESNEKAPGTAVSAENEKNFQFLCEVARKCRSEVFPPFDFDCPSAGCEGMWSLVRRCIELYDKAEGLRANVENLLTVYASVCRDRSLLCHTDPDRSERETVETVRKVIGYDMDRREWINKL